MKEFWTTIQVVFAGKPILSHALCGFFRGGRYFFAHFTLTKVPFLWV